jgi:hypothetical protein
VAVAQIIRDFISFPYRQRLVSILYTSQRMCRATANPGRGRGQEANQAAPLLASIVLNRAFNVLIFPAFEHPIHIPLV